MKFKTTLLVLIFLLFAFQAYADTGSVKWYNLQKGFGFIVPDNGGDDLFVENSDVQCEGYVDLHEGDEVYFDIEQTSKGPKAINVIKRGLNN